MRKNNQMAHPGQKRTLVYACIMIGLLMLLSGCAESASGISQVNQVAAQNGGTVVNRVLSPQAKNSGPDTSATVLLVHGFNDADNGSGNGFDCTNASDPDGLGSIKQYLQASHDLNGNGQMVKWKGDVITIGYYHKDTCDVNLHTADGTGGRCRGYYPQDIPINTNDESSKWDGTNNESIYHLSCLLAWYIYATYTHHPNQNIEIVAHSMGGLIVRNALYQVAQHQISFPKALGNITHIVTLSTPHGGVNLLSPAILCHGCTQVHEMESSSSFMNEIYNNADARHAQTSKGTDWDIIGSKCDKYVTSQEATYMVGAHKTVFLNPPCYTHDDRGPHGITEDTGDKNTSSITYCDDCGLSPDSDPTNYQWLSEGWTYKHNAPGSLHHMMLSLCGDTATIGDSDF